MNEQTNIFGHSVLGIDESGKGDFFGPLVIAGALIEDKQLPRLGDQNIRDSKKISDNKIIELSRWLKENFVHTIVVIGPEKYNGLYEKIKNLNKLLAWGHSRVIENIAELHHIDKAISDKFAKDQFINNALMDKGRKIDLQQIVRGESFPQVAAASILARAAFVQYMAKMSADFKFDFPKGAGAPVDLAARRIKDREGFEIFKKTAKIHFKNYKKI